MNILVYGLGHLGLTTAACLAEKDHKVYVFDPDIKVMEKLLQKDIIFEPGLEVLLQKGSDAGKLIYLKRVEEAKKVDIVWITFDTPLDKLGNPDPLSTESYIEKLSQSLDLRDKFLFISSQLSVSSIKSLQKKLKCLSFHYIPENLRLGEAINIFRNQNFIVVGTNNNNKPSVVEEVLTPFCQRLVWVSNPSAGMVKHAINCFLATSITFANEIARICEMVGASAYEVEAAIRCDARIGENSYVSPGAAFAGGTLGRDVTYLCEIAEKSKIDVPLLQSIMLSNEEHKKWFLNKLRLIFNNNLQKKIITVLGLSYKVNSNSTRCSLGLEICSHLLSQRAIVKAYDPIVKETGLENINDFHLTASFKEAIETTDAIIVVNNYGNLQFPELNEVKKVFILDPNRYCQKIPKSYVHVLLGEQHHE